MGRIDSIHLQGRRGTKEEAAACWSTFPFSDFRAECSGACKFLTLHPGLLHSKQPRQPFIAAHTGSRKPWLCTPSSAPRPRGRTTQVTEQPGQLSTPPVTPAAAASARLAAAVNTYCAPSTATSLAALVRVSVTFRRGACRGRTEALCRPSPCLFRHPDPRGKVGCLQAPLHLQVGPQL